MNPTESGTEAQDNQLPQCLKSDELAQHLAERFPAVTRANFESQIQRIVKVHGAVCYWTVERISSDGVVVTKRRGRNKKIGMEYMKYKIFTSGELAVPRTAEEFSGLMSEIRERIMRAAAQERRGMRSRNQDGIPVRVSEGRAARGHRLPRQADGGTRRGAFEDSDNR